MASLFNNFAKGKFADGTIDWDTDDIRLLLVDSTTTVDTEPNVTTISGYATLGEISGTGYGRKVLTSKAVNVDTSNNRAELDADDIVFTGITAGTTIGFLVFKFVTNDADNIPIAFSEFSSPFVTNGGDLTIQIDAEGMLQLT